MKDSALPVGVEAVELVAGLGKGEEERIIVEDVDGEEEVGKGDVGLGVGAMVPVCGGVTEREEAAVGDSGVDEAERGERRVVGEAEGLPEVVGGHVSRP